MASRRSAGSERVLAKLRASIDRGDYYEAHQMYRTLYFRYSGTQRWSELLTLLREGAHLLLKNHQIESGADLATLYVDTLKAANSAPDVDVLSSVAELYSSLGSDCPDRSSILFKALNWVKSAGNATEQNRKHDQATAKLHELIAMVHWKEGDLVMGRNHLMMSCDGAACGRLLVQLHETRGLPLEIDLFITQAVLQYLSMRRVTEARNCFTTYVEQHPLIRNVSAPYSLPLLNFVHFLLECTDSCNLDHFKGLRQLYGPCLARDKAFDALLDRVGVEIFGMTPPARRRGGGLLGGLLQSLFSDGDSEGAVAMDTTDRASRVRSPASKVAKLDTAEDLD